MNDDSRSHPVAFGPFEWDPARAELKRHGRRVRLTGQPLEILVLLLARADRLVTREELRQALWGERTFVDFEQGMNTAVARLRHALGDSADSPRYIETVPGRGYRFIAPVASGVPTTLRPRAGSPRAEGIDRRAWLAGGLGLTVGAVGTYLAMRRWPMPEAATATATAPGRRFVVSGPPGPELELSNGFLDVAISPDGAHIVYRTRADGASRFFARSLSAIDDGRLLPEGDVYNPFFSPDGSEIGYYRFVNHRLLRTRVAGGSATDIADVSTFVAGASWGEDGRIVFATLDTSEGLLRVPAGGGSVEPLTRPEPGTNHLLPELLPGGRAVLFTIVRPAQPDAAEIAVLDLDSGRYSTLISGSHPRYIPTGHLIFVLDDRLMAVPFDRGRLRTTGHEVTMLEGLLVSTGVLAPTGQYSVSADGALLVVMSGSTERRSPVWVDRNGSEEPLAVAARGYTYPRISPDGRQIALNMRDAQGGGIDIYDVGRRHSTPLTVGQPGISLYPVWTPDGMRVAYQTGVPFERHLMVQTVGSGGPAELLTAKAPDALRALYFFVPSSSELIFARQGDEGPELRRMSLTDGEESVLLPRARNADLSPDGHFIAYQSDVSGRFEVWVRTYPDIETQSIQLSSAGGIQPVWSPRGDELFYIEPGSPARLMSVAVTSGETPGAAPRLGSPRPVIDWPYYAGELGRTYDVSRPDGERFLAIRQSSEGAGDTASPRVEIVLDWFDEVLARSLPA